MYCSMANNIFFLLFVSLINFSLSFIFHLVHNYHCFMCYFRIGSHSAATLLIIKISFIVKFFFFLFFLSFNRGRFSFVQWNHNVVMHFFFLMKKITNWMLTIQETKSLFKPKKNNAHTNTSFHSMQKQTEHVSCKSLWLGTSIQSKFSTKKKTNEKEKPLISNCF